MPKREKAKIMDAMQKSRMRTMETRVMTEMANEASIIDTVVRAHFDTCDYTADKIQPFINKAKAEQAFTHVAQGPGMVSRSIPSHPQLLLLLAIIGLLAAHLSHAVECCCRQLPAVY